MEMLKIKLGDLVSDKMNPRKLVEDVEELADSINSIGQQVPLKVEDMKNGKYLVTDGHRRLGAFLVLKKRTKKEPLVECVVSSKLTPEERLVKQAAIDAQMKNLTVNERDALWKSILAKSSFNDKEFAKKIGASSADVRNFRDRQSLTPEIRKLGINAGILQETIVLPQKHREMVLKYQARTGIGAMGIRQEVKHLKGASDTVVKAFTDGDIDIDTVKKIKDFKEKDQETTILNIKQQKNHIRNIPKLVKDKKLKPKNKQEEVLIDAQKFIDILNGTIADTSVELVKIERTLDELEKLEKFIPAKIKEGMADGLAELEQNMSSAKTVIKKIINKWS